MLNCITHAADPYLWLLMPPALAALDPIALIGLALVTDAMAIPHLPHMAAGADAAGNVRTPGGLRQ